MTRKHFKSIAEALESIRPNRNEKDYPMWSSVCLILATEFKLINTNFNRIKFLEACGWNEEYTSQFQDD